MKKAIIAITILSALVTTNLANAQAKKTQRKAATKTTAKSQTLDDVHLFQNFLRDASITKNFYGEGGLNYAGYDGASSFNIGVQGGYPMTPQIELNAGMGFVSYSVEGADGQSGLSDLLVAGRYNLSHSTTAISAGAYATLPIGEEKVGQGNLNFGAYGALRHPLDNGMVITGTLGLDFMETKTVEISGGTFDGTTYVPLTTEEKTEYKNSFVLAGGVIYPTNDQMSIVGELMLKTEVDYMLLSGGVDYKLDSGSRLRGGLGIGLDDGAPDILIMGSYLMPF
jgi:hypothetical protein